MLPHERCNHRPAVQHLDACPPAEKRTKTAKFVGHLIPRRFNVRLSRGVDRRSPGFGCILLPAGQNHLTTQKRLQPKKPQVPDSANSKAPGDFEGAIIMEAIMEQAAFGVLELPAPERHHASVKSLA